MKKFILHILLFILPVVVGAIIIVWLPLNKKRAYHYLTDDCEGRGAWMYRRIFESEKPVDLAFLGSSHTINGINDTLINQQLAASSSNMVTCNLGYCRLGRDLTYILIKHLLEQKKTKIFIVEVLPDEQPHSHPVFPYLAGIEELVPPKTILNRSYLGNIYNASVARLMYIRQDLYKEPYTYKYGLREDAGFTTNTFPADTNALNIKKESLYKMRHKSHTWTRNINMPYPRAWLANINALVKKNNVRLVFLYIPPYGSPEPVPIEMKTYLQYAPVWIPPDSIFNNKGNWYDVGHLNLKGANTLSTWVAGKIQEKRDLN
jgi:hypothetical protein